VKTLLLLRHAKSDLGSPDQLDIDRPLNQRGQKAAVLIGQWLKQQHIQPEWAVCSPALRVRETVAGLHKNINLPESLIQFNERLYLASLTTLLDVLSQCPDDMDQILLVGHNPGVEELLIYLCGPKLPLSSNGKLITTATLAQINLPDDWHRLTPECGTLKQIVRPSDIKDNA